MLFFYVLFFIFYLERILFSIAQKITDFVQAAYTTTTIIIIIIIIIILFTLLHFVPGKKKITSLHFFL